MFERAYPEQGGFSSCGVSEADEPRGSASTAVLDSDGREYASAAEVFKHALEQAGKPAEEAGDILVCREVGLRRACLIFQHLYLCRKLGLHRGVRCSIHRPRETADTTLGRCE